MRLSIIIALYNNVNYIGKTLNSIIGTGLSNDDFEIIVVNDGSTDNGEIVVQEFIKSNPLHNVQLFSKENGGQSSARNLGIKKSEGRYILFLDSDDFINSNELHKLLQKLEDNDLDLLMYEFIRLDEKGNEILRTNSVYKEGQIYNPKEFTELQVISGAMCRYFYRKELIERNHLYLTEGIFHEDEEFVTKYICCCNRIGYSPIHFYYYLMRTDSSTNTLDLIKNKKLFKDVLSVINSLKRFEMNKSPEIVKILEAKIEQLLVSNCIKLFKNRFSLKDKSELILLLKKEDLLPLKIRYNSNKFKIFALFFNNYIKIIR
ncbi:glycosyltransferase family 2 protein [Empedobacter tilapiae]